MKKSELAFAVIQVPVDYTLLMVAALLAYFLRLQTDLAGDGPILFTREQYLLVVFIVGLVWLLFFAIGGMYNLRRSQKTVDELYRSFLCVSAGTMAVIIFIFLRRELFFSSRFIILASWLLAIILVTAGRFAMRRLQTSLYRRGIGVSRVIVIGKNRTSGIVVSDLSSSDKKGYSILEVLPSPLDVESTQWCLKQLRALHAKYKIDQIIHTDPLTPRDNVVQLIDFADEEKIIFKYAPDLFQTAATNIEVRPMAGIPLVELKRTPLDGWGRVAKRIVDIVGSVVLIILSSPVMLVVAIAVKLDSPGSVIYKNDRVDHEGKTFQVYKFRSYKIEYCTGTSYGGAKASQIEDAMMRRLNTREGPLHKIKAGADPRLTSVGRFIRRTSLDELPQFFNVLKGEMSLVGPRPHMPKEVAKYQRHHKRVLVIKPGVTGLPQISGRSDLPFEDEVRLFVFYIENWSLKLDFQILLKTPMALLKKPKAEVT